MPYWGRPFTLQVSYAWLSRLLQSSLKSCIHLLNRTRNVYFHTEQRLTLNSSRLAVYLINLSSQDWVLDRCPQLHQCLRLTSKYLTEQNTPKVHHIQCFLSQNNTFAWANKMQSETADFAPGTATWRSRSNRLWFGLLRPLYENMTSATKLEEHNRLHCRQPSHR